MSDSRQPLQTSYSLLKPFTDQFRWSNPDAQVMGENEQWNTPYTNYLVHLYVDCMTEDPFISIAWGEPHGRKQLPMTVKLAPFFFVAGCLLFANVIARFLVGFPGAFFEDIERRIEDSRLPKLFKWPLKAVFYLLKQPFKWAETAISAGVQLVNGVVALLCAATFKFSSLFKKGIHKENDANIAKDFFDMAIQQMPRAFGRLCITGLIAVGAYFAGPLGVAALAGPLGSTAAAGGAVAGIGLVGVTGIQGLLLGIKGCFPRRPPGCGQNSSTSTVRISDTWPIVEDVFTLAPPPTSSPKGRNDTAHTSFLGKKQDSAKPPRVDDKAKKPRGRSLTRNDNGSED